MEKKEYLNEEWYQSVKKKITRISLVIFLVGIVIGGSLIGYGIYKQSNAKKVNDERYKEAYKQSKESVAKAESRLTEIENEISTLNNEYNAKNQECDSLDMTASDWYTKVNQCHRDASAIKTKINDLESEQFQLKNADYTVYYDKINSNKYIIFYFLGAGVFVMFGIAALVVYVIAKKREITAFTIQQSMPVAKEAIDKMAPTVGSAAGEIAKGITEGIEEGKKESDE